MAAISTTQVDAILKSIKHHRQDQKKLGNAISDLIYPADNLSVRIGDDLIDSLIDLLEVLFNDTTDAFTWYIYENEFGSKKLSRNINGKEVIIDSTQKLLDAITATNINLDSRNQMKAAYDGRIPRKRKFAL